MMHRAVIVRAEHHGGHWLRLPQDPDPVRNRHFLSVVELQRYTRDQGSSIYFPQAVLSGEDLYDITLTDGDCRLRVTLDPGLNRQVERNALRPGSTLRDAVFAVAMAAQLPECTGASAAGHSYRLLRAEVAPPTHHQDQDQDQDQDSRSREDWDRLPWFGSADPAGSPVPLRASRSLFLPLWNNVDPSGDEWRETPPTEEEEQEEEEEEGRRPSVTVSQLRQSFLSGRHGVAMGTVQHQLIVRVVRKSQLTFYGRADRNCDCPYKALLEVCDHTGSVCVVLWNSVCVAWYRCLKPGDIISLRRYRVKRRYQAQPDDIEISVNSRNPAARIVLLPESSVSPEHLPPAADYNFYTSQQLLDRPAVCDVIGLLTFSGRSERIRSKDGKGAELMEYRWLRLEDGASSRPIMVKLFSTSQPECHRKLLPLSVVVCTNLKPIRVDSSSFLTNTTYTQVYCTGLGHHSQMSYRKLRPVQQFLRWLRRQDDGQVLSRALIGGFFSYPPPPFSLETFMKERRGEPGFLRGAELRLEMDRLCYRERRTFCIQATVTVVTYCLRGEEDRCLFWVDRASSLSPPSSSSSPAPHLSTPPPSPASSPFLPPLSSSTPRSSRPPPSSSSLSSSSAVSQLTPRRSRPWSWWTVPLILVSVLRRPLVTLEPQHNNQTVVLFEASMEFLDNVDAEDDEDDDEDDSSFVSAPLCPAVTPVAMETLAMRYDHTRREEQAAAVAMGGRAFPAGTFDSAPHDSYTLRLRALSDGVLLDAIFLPHAPPTTPPPPHSNTWTSILSHGAFSSHSPAPSPADLIATATQLANQKLVCVLEACHLGGATTELVLSRAFPLSRTDA
ncbi:uncharacterized protein V6R79_024076 [Siganus canaliculatus]